MKHIVKAMDKSGHGLKCLTSKFPLLSNAKIKEGVFMALRFESFLKMVTSNQSVMGRKKLLVKHLR